MAENQKELKPLEIPYLTDDDVKRLVYVNHLMLREILETIKEEVKDVTIQE